MRKSNGNIDHKIVVATWISFADEVKYGLVRSGTVWYGAVLNEPVFLKQSVS